jgi:hypothetical protein
MRKYKRRVSRKKIKGRGKKPHFHKKQSKKKTQSHKIKPSLQSNWCKHLLALYIKWEGLHNDIFNNVGILSRNDMKTLQKQAAHTIINQDLHITPSGTCDKYKYFIQCIKKCNNVSLLHKMKQLLSQIQTSDTIQFSDIKHELGVCKHKDKCYRNNFIHKSIYHDDEDFTFLLINLIQSRLDVLL